MNMMLREHGDLLVDESHPMPCAEIEQLVVKYEVSVGMQALLDNINLAMQRSLPRFFGETVREGVDDKGEPCWKVQWAKHPIAIITGGPTLKKTIKTITGNWWHRWLVWFGLRQRHFKTVMVAGSAHDYVVKRGIIPDYCVLMDAIPEAIDWLKHPQKTTTYLLASQNHPVMFDHLRNYNVHLWHAMGADHEFGDEPSIGGGSTTVLRCLELAFLMGYWDQHYFGLDSCYLDDGTTHAYEDWPNPQQIELKVHNSTKSRTFKTDLGLLGQAEMFIETFKKRKKIMRATVHGDNLITETVRSDFGSEGIRVAC